MSATLTDQDKARSSVVKRFNYTLLALYFCVVLVSSAGVYWFTKQQAYQQAEQELQLLVNMVNSIRGYVGGTLRPYFIDKKILFSPGFSGVVAISEIAGHFKKVSPNYFIRTSSDNPLNPDNAPKPLEKDLLFEFRSNPELEVISKTGYLDGQQLLIHAVSMKSKPGCMRCHGDPTEVFPDIAAKFPGRSGYYYQLGDTVGVNLVGVPIADINALAIERSVYVIVSLTLLFGILFLLMNLVVRNYLISPIIELRDAVKRIAKGELDQPVVAKNQDEIGDLARSIELLRRSFAQAMQRLRKH